MFEQIAQILEDLFEFPTHMVEHTDHLAEDWGLDNRELAKFNKEFCAEFGVSHIPDGTETIEQYMRLVK